MSKKVWFIPLILMLINIYAYATTIRANYEVSYGIFGKIGVAYAVLEKKGKRYTIDIKLEATGLAKILSGGRKEHHVSQGHIQNGLLVTDLYEVIKSHRNVSVKKEYRIDHKKKHVEKKYIKYVNNQKVTEREQILDIYSQEDLLTLYFNLNSKIKNKTEPKTYSFEAIGAERQKGKVTVIIPEKKELPRYKEELGGDAAWMATAIIHQQIFSSKEGRLMLSVAKDGIANRAVLKDVIFFGDIRAKRIK